MSRISGEAASAMRWALSQLSLSDLVESQELLQSFHELFKTGTPLQQQMLCPHKIRLQQTYISEDSDAEDTIVVNTRCQVPIINSLEVSPIITSPYSEPSRDLARQTTAEMGVSGAQIGMYRGTKRRRCHSTTPFRNSRTSYPEVDLDYRPPGSFRMNTLATPPPSEASFCSTPILAPRSSYSATFSPEVCHDTSIPMASMDDCSNSAFDEDPSSPTSGPVASTFASLPVTKSPIAHNFIHEAKPAALSRAREFFESRLGARSSRAVYLVRAVQGFMEANKATPCIREDMWACRSDIFDGWEEGGSIARFRRLYEGHRRIKLRREEYACADRFCYIFLEHDLEQLVKSGDLTMSQGRGRKTAAFHKQAESISSTVDAVRANRKAGRGYLHLLIDGGPGFVLLIGDQVSTIWERKLSRMDISLILEYLKTYLPDIYEAGKSLDSAASQALVDGFVAYGWSRDEVLNTDSALMDKLKSHLTNRIGEEFPKRCAASNYEKTQDSSNSASKVSRGDLHLTTAFETIGDRYGRSMESEPSLCYSATTAGETPDEWSRTPITAISEHTDHTIMQTQGIDGLEFFENFNGVGWDEMLHLNTPSVNMMDLQHTMVDGSCNSMGAFESPLSSWQSDFAFSPSL